jgi:antitoxin HicB
MKKARVHSYQINLTPDEDDGYTVTVPALPGCVSYGRTVAEAKKMAKEAIELHLENLAAHEQSYSDDEASGVLTTVVQVTIPSNV